MAIERMYIVLGAVRSMQARDTLIPPSAIRIRHSVTRDVLPAQKVDAADLSTRDVPDLVRDPQEASIAPAMTIRRRKPRTVSSAAETPARVIGDVAGEVAIDAPLDAIAIDDAVLDASIDESHDAPAGVVDGAMMKTTTARIPFDGAAVVVAAAGNESRRDQDGQYVIAASLPAAANQVISLTALQQGQDGLALADFSNTLADISAPGDNLSSARKGGGPGCVERHQHGDATWGGSVALRWQATAQQTTLVNATLFSGGLLASMRAKGFAPEVEITDRGVGVAGAPR